MLQHPDMDLRVRCAQILVEFLENLPRMIAQTATTDQKTVGLKLHSDV